MKHSDKTNYKKGIINDLSITPSERHIKWENWWVYNLTTLQTNF